MLTLGHIDYEFLMTLFLIGVSLGGCCLVGGLTFNSVTALVLALFDRLWPIERRRQMLILDDDDDERVVTPPPPTRLEEPAFAHQGEPAASR